MCPVSNLIPQNAEILLNKQKINIAIYHNYPKRFLALLNNFVNMTYLLIH